MFINENVSIMNLKKEQWWIHVFATVREKVEMSMFVTRYLSSLLVFVLALKAPGIASNREDDYIHLENDTNTVNAFNISCLTDSDSFDSTKFIIHIRNCRKLNRRGRMDCENYEHCYHFYGPKEVSVCNFE